MKKFTEIQIEKLKDRIDNINLALSNINKTNPLETLCAMGASVNSLKNLLNNFEIEFKEQFFCVFSNSEKTFIEIGFNISNFELLKAEICKSIFNINNFSLIDKDTFNVLLNEKNLVLFNSEVPFNEDLLKH